MRRAKTHPGAGDRRQRAKAARRRARVTGSTRGKRRGPVTRAMGRVAAEREGMDRIIAMGDVIARELEGRGVRLGARWRGGRRV